MSRFITTLFHAVWSVVGVALLVLVSVAVFGGDTWVENLNIADTSQPEQTAQPAPNPQQPPQPTQEQLTCVSDELGEERFTELQQGDQPTPDENQIIQNCLAS